MVIDLRLGRWQTALAGETCDALIFDAPYSERTHSAATSRIDGEDASGLTPQYEAMSNADVRTFCESWSTRCRGWIVSITDSVLAPVWREEMQRVGRYAFAPVPIVIRGMSVRMQQDGPSSWALYAMVSRPRTKAFSTWGILDGAYTGGVGPDERGGGRGKPMWLINALVRDYTRPGDLVCDPFAGWGTTLAAAVSNGRRAIGAEMDPAAYAEAMRRLKRPQQIDLLEAM